MALGLAAEWRIAKRFSIITGFQYHYYSDRAEVGIKMQNTGLPTLPSAYYMPGTGTTYHNQLHFLEIPLMIQVKLLAAKQYGLYWEGGIGYAALIGTNQLFYDKNMGCYYPSPNQIRQTQTFGRTAIVVGYKERTRYMELGPTLDYGFTPLQKAGTNSPTHLYMVGLQYRIFFN